MSSDLVPLQPKVTIGRRAGALCIDAIAPTKSEAYFAFTPGAKLGGFIRPSEHAIALQNRPIKSAEVLRFYPRRKTEGFILPNRVQRDRANLQHPDKTPAQN
ncbi:MAG: hypothetical protein WBL95_11900 [Microcoleus sp.]